jgi:Lrp/AsnC family transcriptional regulator for asnA, asnC and gidA
MRRGEFDELDDGIVRLLQQDGRASNSQMAKRLSVNEATVRNRIARLLAEGWIQVMAVPGAKTLTPKLSAHLRVVVDPQSVAPVAERLAQSREIRYVAISDRMEVLLEGYFKDQYQMYKFITEEINPLSGVQRVSATVVIRLLKYSHDWEFSGQSRLESDDALPAVAATNGKARSSHQSSEPQRAAVARRKPSA